MATYTTGHNAIILTIEGSARANQLKADGIEAKITHMRVYRSPVPINQIPYIFTGEETRAVINTWPCFPNHATTFPLIKDIEGTVNGRLSLQGTLGADVGTFSYDVVGLFLEDDTLYALASTNRLLTKRKGSEGSANIQSLTFTILLQTVPEIASFTSDEIVIDYSKITEVNGVSYLPKTADPRNNIYRVTTKATTPTGNLSFATFLAHQKSIGIGNTSVWILEDCVRVFDLDSLVYTYVGQNKFTLTLPLSSVFPVELLNTGPVYYLALMDINNKFKDSVYEARLINRSKDSSGYHLTFYSGGNFIGVPVNTQVGGILQLYNTDWLYQNAIAGATRIMSEIQYSEGRTFSADALTDPSVLLAPLSGISGNWTKLDGAIEVSTSQFDPRLAVPGLPQPIPYEEGGTEHVQIRSTNVWINKSVGILNPTLTVDKVSVVVGDSSKATISLPNVPAGTQIAWYIKEPIEGNGVIKSPRPLIGTAQLDAQGKATFNIQFNWDNLAGAVSVEVGLVGFPSQAKYIIVTPVRGDLYFSSDEAGTNVVETVDEGSNVYMIFRSVDRISTEIYLQVEPTSTAGDSDFVNPIPRFLNLIDGFSSTLLQVKADATTESLEHLRMGAYSDSAYTNLMSGAVLAIRDTSTTPNPTYRAYFATDALGNNPTTKENLGSKVYLIIKATDVPATLDLTVDWSGSFNVVDDAEPNLQSPLNITLVNGFASYPINSVGDDDATVPDTAKTLTITANRSTTYNIYNEFVSKFGQPSASDSVLVKVSEGVTVVGTSTDMPAIDGRGTWPAGVQLDIENRGTILGRGGDGGYVNTTDGANVRIAGGKGGTAIIGTINNPVVVSNYGTIAGGGGGTGGAWAYRPSHTTNGVTTYWMIFIGGNGGAPYGKGSTLPTVVADATVKHKFAGIDATLTQAGVRESTLLRPNFYNSLNPAVDISVDTYSGRFAGGVNSQAGTYTLKDVKDQTTANGEGGYLTEGLVAITNFGGTTYGVAK